MDATPSGQSRKYGSQLQRTLDALTSPVRREILWLTRDEEVSAGEIAQHFDLTGPTISEHLRILRQAHLIVQRRRGTSRLYRADMAALRTIRPLMAETDSKWVPADDPVDRSSIDAQTRPAVTVAVDVPLGIEEAFASFAAGDRFGAWLGVPVSIDDGGRFATTLQWGTSVRGRYEVVVPPRLIAMRWDFEDQVLPVPGAELISYLRFTETPAGTHVEVHQWLETEEQARFILDAWQGVLGRFAAYATAPGTSSRRPTRPKKLSQQSPP